MLYNLTSYWHAITLHTCSVIDNCMIQSMTKSQEFKLVRCGLRHTDPREEMNRRFINSQRGSCKFPENRTLQIMCQLIIGVNTSTNAGPTLNRLKSCWSTPSTHYWPKPADFDEWCFLQQDILNMQEPVRLNYIRFKFPEGNLNLSMQGNSKTVNFKFSRNSLQNRRLQWFKLIGKSSCRIVKNPIAKRIYPTIVSSRS